MAEPGFIYLNGTIVPEGKAVISVTDRGLNYGDGLFETMKAYSGKVFLLQDHLNRLDKSARYLNIGTQPLKDLAAERGPITELLRRNKLTHGESYIKIILTRGPSPIGGGHRPLTSARPTIIITACKLDTKAISSSQDSGVTCALVSGFTRSATGRLKTLNYLPCVLAKEEALSRGAYEAVFVNKDKYILEGSSTNIFIVSNNTLITPPLDAGILPGITRAKVLRLAKEDGIQTECVPVTSRDLLNANEAMITNSIIEVTPLIEADGKKIGTERPGPVTRRLLSLYQKAAWAR